jgi:hypothetical protein
MAIDEITEAEAEVEDGVPCPLLSCIGKLLDQPGDIDQSGYVPVKCSDCSFTGRRKNLIVVSD